MNDLAVREDAPLTITEIKAHINTIQHVLRDVMKKDVHYGIIPGCKKPSLYQPGAELILSTFKLGVDPVTEDLSTPDEIRYRVRVRGFSIVTGQTVGVGVGECSSNEEKYKWRKPTCDEEYEATPEDRRRVVWKSSYGKATAYKQVRTNPADIANTVLKMAMKRGLVGMTRTATAASDVFEMGLEDIPPEVREGWIEDRPPDRPTINQPREIAGAGDSPPDRDPDAPKISDAQRKRFYAIAKKTGFSDQEIKDKCLSYGFEHSAEITKDVYDELCNWAEGVKPE